VDNSCFIGHIRGVTTQNADAIPVLIDSAGQLGTANSSQRFKTDIKSMNKASESILTLRPVSFRYKVHKDTTPQFGLIAEEVAAVNPNLVIYDSDGKPYTVRCDAVNPMLLNEFLKEHKRVEAEESKIEKKEATIAELKSVVAGDQKRMDALAADIQEMNAQLAARIAAPQVATNR
jgi:uncharacterized coiled-coil protein SlyX